MTGEDRLSRMLPVVVSGLVSTLAAVAYAGYVPEPLPIARAVDAASLVAIVRRVGFIPAPTPPTPPNDGSLIGYTEKDAVRIMRRPVGAYAFEVLQTVKGTPVKLVEVTLTGIHDWYYGHAPEHSLTIGEGQVGFLLLARDETGAWAPVDPTVPFLYLTEEAANQPVLAGRSPVEVVLSRMVDSLGNEKLLPATLHLLRKTRWPALARAVRPLAESQNTEVRADALYCLGTNHDLTAIPKIAALADGRFDEDCSSEAVVALSDYASPEAMPLLAPLLLERSYYTRVNASYPLARQVKREYVPFLIMALHDPKDYVAHNAYCALLHLIATLGKPMSADQFKRRRAELCKPLFQWWQAELRGEHELMDEVLGLPEENAVAAALAQYVPPQAIPPLLRLLYDRKASLRLRAVESLHEFVDRLSPGYLMLALLDPDWQVAYRAYSVLWKHWALPGQAVTQEAFAAHQEAATEPLWEWWRAELAGRHRTGLLARTPGMSRP